MYAIARRVKASLPDFQLQLSVNTRLSVLLGKRYKAANQYFGYLKSDLSGRFDLWLATVPVIVPGESCSPWPRHKAPLFTLIFIVLP